MKAARNFVFGNEDERHDFAAGDEIPDEIVDEIPNHLVLEKLAQADPDELTRDQLLVLAGLKTGDDQPDEFDEEEFLESLASFNDKQALVDWANEILGMELDTSDGTRDQLEQLVVDFARPEEEAGD